MLQTPTRPKHRVSCTCREARRDTQLRRAVTVLKTRASRHEPDVREFVITPDGIVLGEPLSDSMR